MWMMDCDRHSQGFKKPTDPLQKLRPLMPRPRPISFCGSNGNAFPAVTPLPRFPQSPNLTAWNQTLISGACGYGGKRELGGGVPLVSTRWNPTPEQVQALEELYRKGTRTPSAEQIQQIAAKLRRFGKIEGKNVFYWFQNHKARERQKKRRREMELLAGRKNVRHETFEGRQSGLSRRHLEVERPKKLPTTPSKCSTALQYSEPSPMVEDLCQKDRWAQATKTAEFNCCQLDLSSCSLSPNNSIDNIAQKATAAGQENENPFVEFNNLLWGRKDDLGEIHECGIGEDQTLELFPIKGNDLGSGVVEEDGIPAAGFSNVGTRLAPNQFFEFLPTKN